MLVCSERCDNEKISVGPDCTKVYRRGKDVGRTYQSPFLLRFETGGSSSEPGSRFIPRVAMSSEALAGIVIPALATTDRVRRPGLNVGVDAADRVRRPGVDVSVGFGLDVEGFGVDVEGFGVDVGAFRLDVGAFALDLGLDLGAALPVTGEMGMVAGVLGFVDLVGGTTVLSSASVTGPSIRARPWLLRHWMTKEKSSATARQSASAPEAMPHHLNATTTARSPLPPGPRR